MTEKISDEDKITQLQQEVEAAQHDAWVSQVMISTILDALGAVVITKEQAAKDFSGMGIDISETDDGESLILQLKNKEDAGEEDDKS